MNLTSAELTLLIDALAKAASRHESQARSIKFGRRHDEKAAAMRRLRTRLLMVRAVEAMGKVA